MPPKRSKASSFPAARIKRIMQQDDDVGKVAGASPLVVSKAVELFLQDMLQHIEKEARQKNTKKVSMHHVKRAVQNTPSLDFLKDLVASIPDPAADDDDAEFGGTGEKKPRKRAPKAASGESKNGKAKAVKTEGGASAAGSKGKAKQQTQANNQASTSNTAAAAPPAAGPKVSIPISSLLSNRDDDDADYQDDEVDAGVDEPTAMETDVLGTTEQAVKTEEPAQAVRANEEDEDYD